jgi:diacylglycerol kinase (ATP)
VKILLVHNPTAGSGDHDATSLRRLVQKLGSVTYQSVKAKSWTKAFEEEPADLILAAGGDGLVRRVALNAPRGSRISILPLGTANNVANSLGIRGKPKDVIAGLKDPREQPLDLGWAKGPWGERAILEGVGVGAVTEVAARMDAGEGRGAEGQSAIKRARALLRAALVTGRDHWFDVTVDGQSICDKAAFLEVANMRFIGPRLALAPSADPGDGELDVVWLPEEGRGPLGEWLRSADDDDIDAPVRSCRGATIEMHHVHGQIRIDDQYWPPDPDPDHQEAAADIDISVIRRALTVVVPQ